MSLLRERRGSVAMMTAVMAPVLIMSLGMAVEVTSWSVSNLELQRIADAAAWAGAARYAATSNAQLATGAAADLAEINGVSGAATRTWDASTLTTTDNLITAQMVAGLKSASDYAVKVTVKRTVVKSLTKIFPGGGPSVTITASAVAEIGSLGPQPCITALGQGVDGITTGTDVSVVGNATLTATGCSLRSNDGISVTGGGTITMAGIYAGGAISGGGICCDLHPNSGQITDPYAANAPVQNALNTLSSGSGAAISVKSNSTQSISPGTYSSWDVQGTLNLSPGTYYVNGGISAGAQSTINGIGVTILTSGSVSTTGGASLAFSAPLKNASAGIPGVLIAGNGAGTMTFLGNSTSPITGLIYFPNAALKFGGTSSAGSDACVEVVASTVTLVGTSNVAANCSSYGLLSWGSLAGPAQVSLVQ
jgi:Flp pilus assembly protein TadG